MSNDQHSKHDMGEGGAGRVEPDDRSMHALDRLLSSIAARAYIAPAEVILGQPCNSYGGSRDAGFRGVWGGRRGQMDTVGRGGRHCEGSDRLCVCEVD